MVAACIILPFQSHIMYPIVAWLLTNKPSKFGVRVNKEEESFPIGVTKSIKANVNLGMKDCTITRFSCRRAMNE